MFFRTLLLLAVFITTTHWETSYANAEEPVRKWVPLQGPTIEGRLLRYRSGRIFVLTLNKEVKVIELGNLAQDSRSYLQMHKERLPYWQTPDETKLIESTKKRIEQSGAVNVQSKALKLSSIGLVVGTDGTNSFVLCTSNTEKFEIAEGVEGSSMLGWENLKFDVFHRANGLLRRSDAGFEASWPGSLLLKSPFQITMVKRFELSNLALTVGQPLCFINAVPTAKPGDFEYKTGEITELHHPYGFAPGSEVTMYKISCFDKNLEPGSVAFDESGQVVGIISQPLFGKFDRETPGGVDQHDYQYSLGPIHDGSSPEPKFLKLIAILDKERRMVDFAAYYIDPLNKIKQAKLLIKTYDNNLRITVGALRDGVSARTLSGGSAIDLTHDKPNAAIKQVFGDVSMSRCASTQFKLDQVDTEGNVLFQAQIAYRNESNQVKFSKLFAVNLNAELAAQKLEFENREIELRKLPK